MLDAQRTATVVSNHNGMYGRLGREDTEQILFEYPQIAMRVKESLTALGDRVRIFLFTALRHIDIFKRCTGKCLMIICFAMHAHSVPADKVLIREDEEANNMLVIQHGLVEVSTLVESRSDQRLVIERLGRGAVINAHAFLVGDRIDFRVKTITKVTYYTISANQFARVSRDFTDFDKTIQALIKSNFDSQKNIIALDYSYGLQDLRFPTREKQRIYNRYPDKERIKRIILETKNAILF